MTEYSTHPTGCCGMTQPRAAKGLVWEDDPASFDGRFYWSAGVAKALDDVNELTKMATLMQMATGVTLGLKSNAIATVKAQAAACLPRLTGWLSRRQRLQLYSP